MRKTILFHAALFVTSIFFPLLAVAVPDGTAHVFSYEGDVKVIPDGRNIGIPVDVGMSVAEGDWIKTSAGASVTIAFDEEGQNVLMVEENSLVIIKLDGYLKVQLLSGDLFAMLENVQDGEVFRVLTPSVVTESESSGWGVSSDGSYTNVVVFNNKVFVYGLHPDGTPRDERYEIGEGYQRMTLRFQDPGELAPSGAGLRDWFEKQVVAHHLQREMYAEMPGAGVRASDIGEVDMPGEEEAVGRERARTPQRPSQDTLIVNGEEINIVEYLYRQRLRRGQ